MKRLFYAVLAIAMLFALTGCEQKTEETVFAMDTVMQLQLWGRDREAGIREVTKILQEQENIWSATRDTSVLSRLNRGENVEPDSSQQLLLEKVQKLSQRTAGAFDPCLWEVIRAWGFYDENYRIPSQEELKNALAQSRWELGAALKGYVGSLCVTALEQLEVDRAILNLGGNIQTYGEKEGGSPWSIGIQNPNGGDYVGTVAVTGTMAVVTSGDYQRFFESEGVRYHHILDPDTGMPANSGLSSVTIICKDGLTADALSTALFVMGLEEATEFWRASSDFEAVFITTEGHIYATEGALLSGCEYEVIER